MVCEARETLGERGELNGVTYDIGLSVPGDFYTQRSRGCFLVGKEGGRVTLYTGPYETHKDLADVAHLPPDHIEGGGLVTADDREVDFHGTSSYGQAPADHLRGLAHRIANGRKVRIYGQVVLEGMSEGTDIY